MTLCDLLSVIAHILEILPEVIVRHSVVGAHEGHREAGSNKLGLPEAVKAAARLRRALSWRRAWYSRKGRFVDPAERINEVRETPLRPISLQAPFSKKLNENPTPEEFLGKMGTRSNKKSPRGIPRDFHTGLPM